MNANARRPNPLVPWAFGLGISALAIALAHLADRTFLTRIHNPNAADAEWVRMLRINGFVPTWLVIAAAFALIDSGKPRESFRYPLRDRWSRAATLLCAVLLAGLLDEILKLLIRRHRPDIDIPHYVFRPFTENIWSTSGLGMPSSHTAVAFGAAAILCRLHPRAWPIWLALAAGCGFTRILSRAHFFSDVVAGACVGLFAGAIVWTLHLRLVRKAGVTP